VPCVIKNYTALVVPRQEKNFSAAPLNRWRVWNNFDELCVSYDNLQFSLRRNSQPTPARNFRIHFAVMLNTHNRLKCKPDYFWQNKTVKVNSLMDTLKPHSNGPLYSNTVIGTLAVDGWAVTFGIASRGLGGASWGPPSPILAVPNVTPHPSTASVPISIWHYNYRRPLKG